MERRRPDARPRPAGAASPTRRTSLSTEPTTATDGAERRLAILFTDVEGSTQLRSTRGDAAADELLHLHEAIVRRQIAEHHGREVTFMGDGFLATFDGVDDAIGGAEGIQRELAEHARANPDRPLRVRIGLHAGDVVVRDGNLYGQTVNAASRIAAHAAGGEVLVSGAVRDAATDPERHPFRDRGLFWLKGLPERWRLYELETGDGAPAPRIGIGPLVEREEQLADLRRAVEDAIAGHGGLVLLSGEAGVGKTRLTQELDAEAERRGMRILVGHCVEQEAIPYLPFVEAFEDGLVGARSEAALQAALGDAAPEIARMVPALRRAIPDLPPPVELPPDQARRFLWVSVEEFLERAARSRPILLVLEDLHWTDEATVHLLEHLAPSLAEMPVVIVGTYRDVEVAPTAPLSTAIVQLSRRRLVTRVPLGRLSRDGVAALIAGLAGQEPPPELVSLIRSESEGTPFFVEEVFLHLRESGKLFDRHGRFRTGVSVDAWEVPETVRLLLEHRLARLSGATREVLTAAATSGRTFELSVVQRVAGTKERALTKALDEAERAFVVGPLEGGSKQSFTHELIRQTLLAGASSVKRQMLHARTAEALEIVHAHDIEERAADLVYHLSRSGTGASRARLVRYLRLAGEHAARASVFDDAERYFDQALELLGDEEREARAELLERLAMARRSQGRWADALETMNRALDLYESLGRTQAIGRLGWAMVYHLAWAARFEDAVGVARRALAALGDAPSADRGRIASAAAWAMGLAGDHEGSTATFAQARQLAEAIGDERALADILHMETIHHLSFAEFAEGVETGLRAAKVFEAEGALWDLASVLAFVGYEAGAIPRSDVATENVARAAPIAERLGHLGATFMTLAARVRLEGVAPGDLGAIESIGAQMVEVCERGGLPWLYVGHMYLGLAAFWRGEAEEGERRLRLAAELEPPAAFAGQSASLLALHLAYVGRGDDAVEVVESLRPAFPVAGRVNTVGSWNAMFGCVEALAVAGRRDEAADLFPLVMEALELRGEWITFDGALTGTRAAVATAAAGRYDEADRLFAAAADASRELGLRIGMADVRRLHAGMLLERGAPGDPERARAMLEDAASAYGVMGMPPFEALSRSFSTGA